MSVKHVCQTSTVDATEWEPFEVAVTEGDPSTQVHWLRDKSGGEGVLFAGLFRAEPGRFDYEFSGDETFHMLEGEIAIALESDDPVTLRAGDIASFPKGAKSTWEVRSPMKKFFVISG
jgi:uncharacterized cupin superfamily protein